MDKILAKGQLVLLAFAALYTAFLTLLTIPYFQRHAIFLHAIHWPLFSEFDNPAKYGLPTSRSINIQIKTADNVKLGAWLVLPLSKSRRQPFDGPPSADEISESISNRPTVLFFHGNAATRAVPFRVQHCSTYASRFDANVLAIDYRGFGDSEGTPTEEGLIADARAAWDWTIRSGAHPKDILLVGHSLGTGVVSRLGAQLAQEGIQPKGVVLFSPFTSIASLLTEYRLFGIFPILQPLDFFPPLQKFSARFLVTQFNTSQVLPTIKAPILLAHSNNDHDVPHKHSRQLFDAFVDELIPPAAALPSSPSELKNFDLTSFKAAVEQRRVAKSTLVTTQGISKFGTAHRLSRPNDFGEVIFVEASYGGHDRIGLQDSLIDLMDYVFF